MDQKAGKPKKPVSGYVMYLEELRRANTFDKGVSGPEQTKIAGGMWKGLSESQRAKYNDESARLRTIWRQELEAWESKQ